MIGDKATFERLAPVFPVRDIARSIEHYKKLGFDVEAFDGAPYAFCRRDATEIHLTEVGRPALKPKRNMSATYLYVNDADALYAEWSQSGASGRHIRPVDTDYGLREGAHTDEDNNLIRYGSNPRS